MKTKPIDKDWLRARIRRAYKSKNNAIEVFQATPKRHEFWSTRFSKVHYFDGQISALQDILNEKFSYTRKEHLEDLSG